MGKPLSRPDCLRQNPSCVGKGEEEDLNIDDCYVPQRSIYDTVRLNEQIDSGSKGSLASRHLVGTLPYSHRTLDMSALFGNGVLASSSAFELRSRETVRLDERVVFDGLKLNGDIIRGVDTVLCKPLPVGEKREPAQHRRSWRTFAPTNLSEYGSCSGTLCNDGMGQHGLGRGGRGGSMTNSLTSEGDSGLCSPTVERDQRNARAKRRPGPGTRSLSSTEGVHVSGDLKPGRSLSSGQEEFPFSPMKDRLPTPLYCTVASTLGSQEHNNTYNSDLSVVQRAVSNSDCPDINIRTLAESSSKTHNSKTFSGYEELPTAELLEDTCSQDVCELLSVVVTEPKTLSHSRQNLEQHVTKDEKCYECEQIVTDSKMADLEDFLLLVEREAGFSNGIKHVDDEDIESLLTSIATCSQMKLVALPSTQVPQNSRRILIV